MMYRNFLFKNVTNYSMNLQNTLQAKTQIGLIPIHNTQLSVIRGGLFSNSTMPNNWAFIDIENLYKGVQEYGWKINWKLFRKYLSEYHDVTRAFMFMGFIPKNARLYKQLEQAGFILMFRTVKQLPYGRIDGGNVDADLAGSIMDYKRNYSKAVVIADDADYCNTIKSLLQQDKLKIVISSHTIERSAQLIRAAIGIDMMISIHSLRKRIEFTGSYKNNFYQ